MKTPLFLLGLLVLALLLVPPGHSACHRHHYLASPQRALHTPQLLPLRVVRTPAVAQQHRQVRAVQ